MMCQLVVSSSSQSVTVEGERARRLLLVVLKLLPDVEGITKGQVTLSWGPNSGIKWSVQSYGEDDHQGYGGQG